MTKDDGTQSPPDGFRPLPFPPEAGPFILGLQPWYGKDQDGLLVCGFYALPSYLNPAQVAHGGMLATFCDMMTPICASYQIGLPSVFMSTATLHLDYLLPVPAGTWVESRTDVFHEGERMVFAQTILTSNGAPVVRASGIFMKPSKPLGVPTSSLRKFFGNRGRVDGALD